MTDEFSRKNGSLGGDVAISVKGARKSYGKFEALKGLDLEVKQGEFFALLGPNGAGKTTLISLLAGLARPDSGELSIHGFDVSKDYRQARRAVGVVPQELVFDPFFSVRETLNLQSGYFGIRPDPKWIDELLENLQLRDKADSNMRSLSGGMKRRVLVAQALVHHPSVLILDEPTAGVDVELRQTLWKFIRRLNEEGMTILLTTHYLEEAQTLCNRVAMMKTGQVIALDTTQNLLAHHSRPSLTLSVDQGVSLPQELMQRATPLPAGRYRLGLESFAEVEHILSACRQAGVILKELEVGQADLEEVFVRIMKEPSR